MANLTGDIIIRIIDKEGKWFLNDGACRFWGKSREELLGFDPADYLHPDDVKKIEAAIQKMHKTKKIVRGVVVREKTPKGWRIVEWNAAPILDEVGNYAGLQATGRDITEHKQAEKNLLNYQKQLRSLASELALAEERERYRIATELHDQISQYLVISKTKLETLREAVSSSNFAKALDEICDLLGQSIQNTRALTFDLSSPILYELGFEAAVSEWLAEQIQEKHGIAVEFEDDGQPKSLDDDECALLFRMVRELLINVVKHAHAHKVKVSSIKVNNHIHISVEDDGAGFNPTYISISSMPTKKGGFGLFSIRERLEQLGGHLEVDSKPSQGTKITIIAPLKKRKKIKRQI